MQPRGVGGSPDEERGAAEPYGARGAGTVPAKRAGTRPTEAVPDATATTTEISEGVASELASPR